MSCSSQPFTFSTQTFFNNQCFDCQDNGCGSNIQNSRCVIYSGPNLSCSGIQTNDSLEYALQKIDTQICSVIGDYSTYQYHCLDDWFGQAITQESQFVSAISEFACEIRGDLNFFIDTTFGDFQSLVDQRFSNIETPGVICTSAGVASGDDFKTVLEKYCDKFDQIDEAISVASVVWNACFTVVTPPTTVAEGFIVLANQICQLKNTVLGLPTFNNTGTCLSAPTSSDTLEETIQKITTRLCQTPTFNRNDLSWGCVPEPTFSSDQDITSAVQAIIDEVSGLMPAFPSFTGDFTITPNDADDPCQGVTIGLVAPLNTDRFVAADASDFMPGTLADKLLGTNITFDYVTTPGKVILSGEANDHKVLADAADDTPDYLDAKVEGGTDVGISITTSYNAGTKKVAITPSVDLTTLVNQILTYIGGNPTTLATFCNLVASCAGGGGSTPGVKNVFVINSTGLSITIDTDNGTYTFAAGVNGNIVCTDGGFVKNNSGVTHTFQFIESMPSTMDPDETPNPDTLITGASHTLNNPISNLNYIIVT